MGWRRSRWDLKWSYCDAKSLSNTGLAENILLKVLEITKKFCLVMQICPKDNMISSIGHADGRWIDGLIALKASAYSRFQLRPLLFSLVEIVTLFFINLFITQFIPIPSLCFTIQTLIAPFPPPLTEWHSLNDLFSLIWSCSHYRTTTTK